jgi:hypothetical protein
MDLSNPGSARVVTRCGDHPQRSAPHARTPLTRPQRAPESYQRRGYRFLTPVQPTIPCRLSIIDAPDDAPGVCAQPPPGPADSVLTE